MDVSRETPDVTSKPKCYDLTNLLVRTTHVMAPEVPGKGGEETAFGLTSGEEAG